MKKRHIITIAVAFTLAMVITGTMVMSGSAGETTAEVQVVDEITEEYPTVETVDIEVTRSNPDTEEIMAMYPGYLEFLKASQSQADDTDSTELPWVPNIYADSPKAFQSQADVIDSTELPWMPNIYIRP